MTKETKILVGVGVGLPLLLVGSYYIFGPGKKLPTLPPISTESQHQIGMAVGWSVLAAFASLALWAVYLTWGQPVQSTPIEPQRDPTPVIHGFVCQTCGVLSEKRKEVYGGSWAVELLLYILFCVPGFIYTAWRYSARKAYCRACGGTSIIPINTPVGIEIYNRYHRH